MMEYAPTQAELAARISEIWTPLEDGKAIVKFAPPDLATVQGYCLEATGHFAANDARWVSVIGVDRDRGLIFVLNNFTLNGDAELMPLGHLGLLNRDARGLLCWWAFNVIGLRRITVRICGRDRRLQEFARRLGLRHEGTQRAFYGPGDDCSLWGTTHDEARLLLKREPAAAPAPSNAQVH